MEDTIAPVVVSNNDPVVQEVQPISKEQEKINRRNNLKLRIPSESQILDSIKKSLKSEFPDLEIKSEEKQVGWSYAPKTIIRTVLLDPQSNTEIFVTESNPRKKTFKRFIQMKMIGGYSHKSVTDLKVRRLKDIEIYLEEMKIELYNNRAEFLDRKVEVDKEQELKEKVYKRFQKRHEGMIVRIDYLRLSGGTADVYIENVEGQPFLKIQYRLSGLNTKNWKIVGTNVSMAETLLKNFYITVKNEKQEVSHS